MTDHGEAIGAYGAALLDNPLLWSEMRQVYRLLGLVKKWGTSTRHACGALDVEAVDINLVAPMLERGREDAEPDARPDPVIVSGRFARGPSEFAVTRAARA